MKIAISGASGLIGSALVTELGSAGHDIVKLVLLGPPGGRRTPLGPDGRCRRS